MKKEEKSTAAETQTEPVQKEAAERKVPAKTAAAKKTAKQSAAAKSAVKVSVYLQYMGREISKDDLMQQVKAIWTKELKRKVSDLKSVALYLKPEENAAYYVINDETTGKLDL